jgi:hypothetical protein
MALDAAWRPHAAIRVDSRGRRYQMLLAAG